MKCLVIAAASLVAGPASAANFQFFEGNNCKGNTLGSIDNAEQTYAFDRPLLGTGRNDEIRSVRVTSNWRRVIEPRSPSIVVYDADRPDTRDDWARVIVRDAMLIPSDGVCGGSFEKPFDRDGVFLERHPHNGLDGKISDIASECGAACLARKTFVPEDFKTKISRRHK